MWRVAGGGQERGIYAASTWITLRCAVTGGRATIEAGSSPRSFRVVASSCCIVPSWRLGRVVRAALNAFVTEFSYPSSPPNRSQLSNRSPMFADPRSS